MTSRFGGTSRAGKMADVLVGPEQDSPSVVGSWAEAVETADVTADEEVEAEASWISVGITMVGVPLRGPASVDDLPRAEPVIWLDLDWLSEDA